MLGLAIDRRMLSVAVLVASAVTWSACVSVNATKVSPGRSFSPVPKDRVRIFQAEDDVPGEYTEVAILHASGQENWTDQSDMMNKMREKAAELGANGIVLGGIEEPGTGEQIVGALFGTGADREGKALGIRWGELSPDSASSNSVSSDSSRPDSTAEARPDTSRASERPLPHVWIEG